MRALSTLFAHQASLFSSGISSEWGMRGLVRALPPSVGTAAVDLTTEVISNHLQREAVVIGECISSVRSTGALRKYDQTKSSCAFCACIWSPWIDRYTSVLVARRTETILDMIRRYELIDAILIITSLTSYLILRCLITTWRYVWSNYRAWSQDKNRLSRKVQCGFIEWRI